MNTSNPNVPRGVAVLALSLVGVSLLNIVFLMMISDPPLSKTIQRGVRLGLTCLLAYFLWRGAGWARWVSVVISALAFITSVIGFAVLPENIPTLFRVWLAFLGVFYLSVFLALLIPSHLTRYFGTR